MIFMTAKQAADYLGALRTKWGITEMAALAALCMCREGATVEQLAAVSGCSSGHLGNLVIKWSRNDLVRWVAHSGGKGRPTKIYFATQEAFKALNLEGTAP